MKVSCPSCHRTVEAEDIALDTGWAKCRQCDELFELSEIVPGLKGKEVADARIVVPERPFDARVVVRREPRLLAVHVPAGGFGLASVGLLLFAGFWLSFIAFWTLGALGLLFGGRSIQWDNALFAAFSVPFWFAGFGMLLGVAWLTWGKQNVLIDPARMVSEWRCLFFRRTRSMGRDEVQCARKAEARTGKDHDGPVRLSVEIVHRQRVCSVPCRNPAEQAWLQAEIEDFLRKVPYDARYFSTAGDDTAAMNASFVDDVRREPFG